MLLNTIVSRNLFFASLPAHVVRLASRDSRGRFLPGNPYRFGKTADGTMLAQDIHYGTLFVPVKTKQS
jgi:hypothetical protein